VREGAIAELAAAEEKAVKALFLRATDLLQLSECQKKGSDPLFFLFFRLRVHDW
jgi:hypothetical protein